MIQVIFLIGEPAFRTASHQFCLDTSQMVASLLVSRHDESILYVKTRDAVLKAGGRFKKHCVYSVYTVFAVFTLSYRGF